MFTEDTSSLVFEKTGYILEVIHNEICMVTVPYLKNWTEDGGIHRLKEATQLGVRQKIQIANGTYAVTILGGFTLQDGIEEATFEFQCKAVSADTSHTVKDIGFSFTIEK